MKGEREKEQVCQREFVRTSQREKNRQVVVQQVGKEEKNNKREYFSASNRNTFSL
jgi:hypothetical protein